MTSRERIYRTIEGEKTDRIPFSFWRHFPDADQTSQGLAKAVIDFQKKFDFDLVKVTPASGYLVKAFGGKFVPASSGLQKGTKECISYPINSHLEWEKIKVPNTSNGILARELDALKLIKKEVGNDTPIVQTIPSPLTLAKMIRGESIFDDLKEHGDDLKPVLSIITESLSDFSMASIKAGADGIFFFTHVASFNFLTEPEHEKFNVKYDLQVLNALKEKNSLLVLHIHGLNIISSLFKNYPVQIINWHDQLTSPSLAEAQKLFNGAALGGIDENSLLLNGKSEEIQQQIKKITEQTSGKRLIVGPGCVIPINTPDANIKAIKEALF